MATPLRLSDARGGELGRLQRPDTASTEPEDWRTARGGRPDYRKHPYYQAAGKIRGLSSVRRRGPFDWYQEAAEDETQGLMAEFWNSFQNALTEGNMGMVGSSIEAAGILMGNEQGEHALKGRDVEDIGRSMQGWAKGLGFGKPPSVESWAKVEGMEDALRFLAGGLGSGLGSTLPSLATGAAGALGGARVGGRRGMIAGGLVGASIPAIPLNLGEAFDQFKREGVDPHTAATAASLITIPITMLDSAGVFAAAAGLGFKSGVKKAILARVAQGISQGIIAEGGTEALQSLLREVTASYLTGNPDLQARAIRVLDEATIGGLTGGTIGAGGALFRGPGEAPVADEQDDLQPEGGGPTEPPLEGEFVEPPVVDDVVPPAGATVEGEVVRPEIEGAVVRSDGTPYPSDRAALLAARGRKLLGHRPVQVEGGWALLPAPEPEAPAPPAEPDAPAIPLPGPTAEPEERPIGTNNEGKPLFEDERGVRSYVDDGVRVTERSVTEPGGGVSIYPDSRWELSQPESGPPLDLEPVAPESIQGANEIERALAEYDAEEETPFRIWELSQQYPEEFERARAEAEEAWRDATVRGNADQIREIRRRLDAFDELDDAATVQGFEDLAAEERDAAAAAAEGRALAEAPAAVPPQAPEPAPPAEPDRTNVVDLPGSRVPAEPPSAPPADLPENVVDISERQPFTPRDPDPTTVEEAEQFLDEASLEFNAAVMQLETAMRDRGRDVPSDPDWWQTFDPSELHEVKDIHVAYGLDQVRKRHARIQTLIDFINRNTPRPKPDLRVVEDVEPDIPPLPDPDSPAPTKPHIMPRLKKKVRDAMLGVERIPDGRMILPDETDDDTFQWLQDKGWASGNELTTAGREAHAYIQWLEARRLARQKDRPPRDRPPPTPGETDVPRDVPGDAEGEGPAGVPPSPTGRKPRKPGGPRGEDGRRPRAPVSGEREPADTGTRPGTGTGARDSGTERDDRRTHERERDESPSYNHRIEEGALQEDRSLLRKAADNLDAIKVAKHLAELGIPASHGEQNRLALYVGWGGNKGAFPDSSGKFGKGYEQIGEELRNLLTPEEYQTAQRSIQYAHYTSETVVRSMWSVAQRLGFTRGSVLEPGMGIGNFPGMMPGAIAAGETTYYGVEMDGISALIARYLYPRYGVQHGDFTRLPLPPNTFDLAIGNPPFADIEVLSDPKYVDHKFLLHDYFFAKSLDSIRPGRASDVRLVRRHDEQASRECAPVHGGPCGSGRRHPPALDRVQEELRHRSHHGHRDPAKAHGGRPRRRRHMGLDRAGHPAQRRGRNDDGEGERLVRGAPGDGARRGGVLRQALQGAATRCAGGPARIWRPTWPPRSRLSPRTSTRPPSRVRASTLFTDERKEGSYYLSTDGHLMQYSEGGREAGAAAREGGQGRGHGGRHEDHPRAATDPERAARSHDGEPQPRRGRRRDRQADHERSLRCVRGRVRSSQQGTHPLPAPVRRRAGDGARRRPRGSGDARRSVARGNLRRGDRAIEDEGRSRPARRPETWPRARGGPSTRATSIRRRCPRS